MWTRNDGLVLSPGGRSAPGITGRHPHFPRVRLCFQGTCLCFSRHASLLFKARASAAAIFAALIIVLAGSPLWRAVMVFIATRETAASRGGVDRSIKRGNGSG